MRCALLLAVGTTFQLVCGDVPSGFFRHPWGLVIAVNYLYLLVLAYSFSGRYRWIGTLWDGKACISSMVSMAFLVIISGFYRITATWPFNLMLFYFMTAVGIRMISELSGLRNLHGPRPFMHRVSVAAMHAGVFLFLWAGIFGSGDKVRYKMVLSPGMTADHVRGGDGDMVRLPFSVGLKRFTLDEYPPCLHIFNHQKGMSHESLSAESGGEKACIDGWELTVDTLYLSAGRIPGEDAYRRMDHVGAVPAAFVEAVSTVSGERCSGWVSCGSHIFASSSLDLGDGSRVVMPVPQARRYLSEIHVTGMDGVRHDYDVEVNHPARYGAWRIYQAGYDTSRGKWSGISVLECVKDSWAWLKQAALWLLLASSVVIFAASGAGRAHGGKKIKEE